MTHLNLEHKPVTEAPAKSHGKEYWKLTWKDIDEINSVLNGELPAVQADEASPIRGDS